MLLEKLFERLAFVGVRVIQQHHHRAVKMAEQVPQEQNHFLLSDIVIEKVIVEVQLLLFRADRDARDHGNFIPLVDMPMNGSFSHRSPGFGHMGKEEKSGFVAKH